MLSLRVTPIKNAKKAAEYYPAKENYYVMGERYSAWEGRGAERLGLSGSVEIAELENMLNGRLPNGEVMGFKDFSSGEIKHRGGYDLTFSAPKSVSFLALVCGHRELVTLHQQAVSKVLGIVEREAAQARKSTIDGMTFEKTNNLCFATVVHDTSREHDPELHTHALLMNATERSDGKWRALASDIRAKEGTMEWIMKNQIYLGMVYRSELAAGLKNLGLETEKTGGPHGLFEIKHVDKTLLAHFSKRRKQIEARVESMQGDSLKAHDKATRDTRAVKKTSDPEALKTQWQEESRALGVEPQSYLETLKEKTRQASQPKTSDFMEQPLFTPVQMAISHLEEKKLSFGYQDILQASLYFSNSQEGIDELIQGIEQAITDKNLIALDIYEKKFTTETLVGKEKNLLELLENYPRQKGIKDISPAIDMSVKTATHETLQKALADKAGIVRIKQKSATDFNILNICISLAEKNSRVRILASSASMANTLNKVTRKEPQNLWQWLISHARTDMAETVAGFNHHYKNAHDMPFFKERKRGEVLIVDDVKRLKLSELENLLVIAERRGARAVLIEKANSLDGYSSDIPDLLDKAKVKAFTVDERPVVNKNIAINAVGEKDERLQAVASHYLNALKDAEKTVQIVASTKAEALSINLLVREGLKNNGTIGREEKVVHTLHQIPLTASERKMAKSYKPGYVLYHEVNRQTKKLTVVTVNERDNRLSVRDHTGRVYGLDTEKISARAQIYEDVPLAVAVGEKLRITANSLHDGLKAGESWCVTKFSPFGLILGSGKKSRLLQLEEGRHFPLAHDYADSLHASSVKKSAHVIFTSAAHALRKNVLDRLSEQSTETLTVFTDDKNKASRYLAREKMANNAINITMDAAVKISGSEKKLAESTDLMQALNEAIITLTGEKPVKSEAEKALEFAITHLSEREAVFEKTEILKVALEKSFGKFSMNEIQSSLACLHEEGTLIAARDDKTLTREALDFERNILETVKTGKHSVVPLLNSDATRARLEKTVLTRGQKDACQLILSTNDRFVMIQGYAGTGKTTMTKSVIEVIDETKKLASEKIDIVAVAPTHQAVKEMKALGIAGQTLKSFIIEQDMLPTLTRQSLVILDESSMVSNRDFAALVNHIAKAGSRCALLGDISQHQSIESGKPGSLLLKTGSITVACMDDLVRQQVEKYRHAVETLVSGKTDLALQQFAALPQIGIERKSGETQFSNIESSVVEVSLKKKNTRNNTIKANPDTEHKLSPEGISKLQGASALDMAVDDYLSRTSDCRSNTIVIIHENKHREIANEKIREGLMAEGMLGTENKPFSRLASTSFTTAELYHSETYSDILQKKEPYYLKKNNQYYRITSMDTETKVVFLEDEGKNKTIFMPEKESQDWKIELFSGHEGKVSVGEKIHFKKSDKLAGRFANEKLEVTQVSEESFTVRDAGGKTRELKKNAMKDAHWDYSYTATSYSIQGASSRFVIGVALTTNKKTNHYRSFYIMESRGSLHAMIYTDNYEQLKKQIRITPDKTSAIEALYPERFRQEPEIQERKNASVKQDRTVSTDSLKSRSLNNANSSGTKTYASEKQVNLDAREITANLAMNAEHIVTSLLGEPNTNMTTRKEMRYGTKGSLVVSLQGEKRGTWFNFETGEKGNLLHLVQNTLGLNFRESLQYAAKMTGDDLNLARTVTQKPEKFIQPKQSGDSQTRRYASQLVKESQPVEGTLAEKYLLEHRAIENIYCKDMRYHPAVSTGKNESVKSMPALLGIVKNWQGEVLSVQAIYLDPKTGQKADIATNKRRYGSADSFGMVLGAGKDRDCTTWLAEGLETGLSIRDARPHDRVVVTFGIENFSSINPAILTNKVVIAKDNDMKNIHQERPILNTVEHLTRHGKEVLICEPKIRGDFNDIAQRLGKEGVMQSLSNVFSVSINTNLNGRINVEQFAKQMKLDSSKLKYPEQNIEQVLEKIEREIY